MDAQADSGRSGPRGSAHEENRGVGSTRTVVVGGAVVLALAVGWFALSHFVIDTATGEAIGESLGVALGLLVLASIIGAVLTSRSERRSDPG